MHVRHEAVARVPGRGARAATRRRLPTDRDRPSRAQRALPAINSLLTAIGDSPARVFLEAGHDDDKQLPVVRTADVVWVDRKNSWQALVKAVGSSAFEAGDHFGWWHATTEPPGRWPR